MERVTSSSVCQHMLTAASLVLTLDILRVINNEVAVPHHREIHRQLTDFHSLIQILEAKDGEKEGERDKEIGVKVEKRQKERQEDFSGRFENLNSHDSLQMQHYVLPMLPQSYIISSSES